MSNLILSERAVSVQLEAHHRLCLEVNCLQEELKGLKDGSWKRFQRPFPEEKRVMDVQAVVPQAEPLKKMRLCACGCGQKRQCKHDEEQSLPLLSSLDQEWTKAPPGADPAAQRAYHERLAQPRKMKESGEDTSSNCNPKQVADLAYLEQLAIPRAKARELSQKQRSGPVPRLPDLRGLQAKVIAADECCAKPPKPQNPKPPPFICCPAKHLMPRSISTPELQGGYSKPLGVPPSSSALMPRPQRRMTASRLLSKDEMPGLGELRMRKAMDVGKIPMPLRPAAKSSEESPRKESKRRARTVDAQQSYIEHRLSVAPQPKRKQDVLMMKLEALRNERLGRDDPSRQWTKCKAVEVQAPKTDEEETVMPDVNWDLLI